MDKILAEFLTDLTLKSKIEFIDATNNQDLIDLAKSKGIILPSPDLSCFRAIYCELDKPNLNNAMLPKDVAEKGINTLVGKQININHLGKNYICGYTIDAKVKDNFIIIIGIFFKSLFQDEFEEIKQLFEDGKLFLSFELWISDPETGNSIVEILENGIKKITTMIAHGVGLLLKGVQPACKKAHIFQLLAQQKDIKEGEQIFQEDSRFAYASFTNEVVKCTHCTVCQCTEKEDKKLAEEIKIEEVLDNDYEGGEIEEAKKLTTEQRNALPDSDFALIQEREGKKVRRFPINDEAHVRNALARLPQAKDISEEEKKSALEKILKKAKELNMTELLKKYEKAEETIVPEVKPEEVAKATTPEETPVPAVVIPEKTQETVHVVAETVPTLVKVVTEETVTTTEVPNETGSQVDRKGMRKRTTTYSDGKEEVITEEYTVVDTYSYADVEAKVAEAKAEGVTKIAEKETEISNLKAELEKNISEKDTEIATLKTQLEKPKVEEKPEITVGNVEKGSNHYKETQEGIDKKGFPAVK